MLNAFEPGTGGTRGGVEGVLLPAFVYGEEDVRTPGSGDDGGEIAKALCGEPPGVFVVLRSRSPNDVDLIVGEANGDSAVKAKLLLSVGVPNTEVLASPSDAFSGVFSSVVGATGVVPNPAGAVAAKAPNPPPDTFGMLTAPKFDAKVVGAVDAKAPPESLLSSVLLFASNAEPKVAGVPDANALNPPAFPELAALISGEPKPDTFAGTNELPKVAGVLAKAANPLAEVDGAMPKPGFPKAGCPNEDFPKAGDANPD